MQLQVSAQAASVRLLSTCVVHLAHLGKLERWDVCSTCRPSFKGRPFSRRLCHRCWNWWLCDRTAPFVRRRLPGTRPVRAPVRLSVRSAISGFSPAIPKSCQALYTEVADSPRHACYLLRLGPGLRLLCLRFLCSDKRTVSEQRQHCGDRKPLQQGYLAGERLRESRLRLRLYCSKSRSRPRESDRDLAIAHNVV